MDIPTVERFRNEAKLLKNLTHPGIPRFLEFFTIEESADTKLYLVRELVEGRNLRELVDEGIRFTERSAILLAISILDILIYLHDFSPPVIHKDIKPENIVLGAHDAVHLVDFNFIGDETLAGDGSLIGRYGYVAPDQLRKEAGPTSDIYALAMTVFFVLSRKDPATVKRTSSGRFAYGPLVNISPAFLAALEKMTAPAITDRYPAAREAKDALLALLAPPRKDNRLLIALVAALLVIGSAYVLSPGRRAAPVRSNAPTSSSRIITDAYSEKRNDASVAPRSSFQSNAPPIIHIGFDGSLAGTGVRFTGPGAQSEHPVFIPGASGQAVELPGSLEYVQDLERNFPDSYSVVFRLKCNEDCSASPEHLSLLRTGMLTFDVRGHGRAIVFVHFAGGGHFNVDVSDASSPLRSARWIHIAFVKDHLQERFFVYRDGLAIAARPIHYRDNVPASVLDVIKFGRERSPANRSSSFGLDEFEVYDYARSPEQIARDAGSARSASGLPATERMAMTPDGAGIAKSGRLMHAGSPITEFTGEAPAFWFRNEVTGQEAREVRTAWDQGVFRFTGLRPGRYGVQVWLNAEKNNSNGYPGDYETWHTFIVQEGDADQEDIDVMKVMHLTSPQDNRAGMTRWDASCEGKHVFASPVLFSWESLGSGVEYRYTVDNRPETTASTSVSIDFPLSERNRCHSFKLSAFQRDRIIGRMLTHGINGGLGWDYVFRVE